MRKGCGMRPFLFVYVSWLLRRRDKFRAEYSDKFSGKDTNRPGLAACLAFLHKGDTLHVHSLDRLGCNTLNILELVKQLNDRGVAVRFHKEGITADITSTIGKMMLTMLSAVATCKRELMLERKREAKAVNPAKGGKGKAVDRAGIVSALAAGGSVRNVAKDFNVNTSTVKRIKAEQEA
ncbi:recombinase family protein [Enterobacter cloacae]|nr:recombinase family protein [Enterobacter cloacae]